jgi:hypothetical protein
LHNISGYKLVKLQFKGTRASVYDVVLDDGTSLLQRFIDENIDAHRDEVVDILARLTTICGRTGARLSFFKENEGIPGDGVCALYDDPDSNLRLYCVRYGTDVVVVGGGGPKSKSISAFQESGKLTKENYIMRKVSQDITQKMKDGDLSLKEITFEGDLQFNSLYDE